MLAFYKKIFQKKIIERNLQLIYKNVNINTIL